MFQIQGCKVTLKNQILTHFRIMVQLKNKKVEKYSENKALINHLTVQFSKKQLLFYHVKMTDINLN